MTGWARILRGALVAALLADGAFVLARAHADGALHAQRSPFASGSGPAGLPSGYLADGTPYKAPAHFGCALIQYISTERQYCRIERPVADTLAERLQQKGCILPTLAPAPVEMPLLGPKPARAELAYIRPGWLEAALRLQVEPTTMLLGPHGKLLWFGVGTLTAARAGQAIAALPAALR